MNYENKIVLLSAKAYFQPDRKPMLMKNFHIGLLPRIIIAIILGILSEFPTGFAGTAVRNIQCHFQ